MRIGFLSNKLTLRGTEVCLFDYAHFNETILGNESIIITRPYEYVKIHSPRDVHIEAYNKFTSRFKVEYYIHEHEINGIIQSNNLDVLFIEKAGSKSDGLVFDGCKTIIHCVFNSNDPHGSLYTCISQFVNEVCQTNFPVLPYMVHVHDTQETLRSQLGIPEDAIVFGSMSGADEYTLDYVKQAVIDVATNDAFSNIYFVYLNIDPFGPPNHKIKFLPGTSDMKYKRMFINTCDAMLYARKGGETFGLACGEFSICDKPVIARPGEHSKAHEIILGNDMIVQTNYNDCYDIITNWHKYKKDVSKNGYKEYSPEKVMANFDKYLKQL